MKGSQLRDQRANQRAVDIDPCKTAHQFELGDAHIQSSGDAGCRRHDDEGGSVEIENTGGAFGRCLSVRGENGE